MNKEKTEILFFPTDRTINLNRPVINPICERPVAHLATPTSSSPNLVPRAPHAVGRHRRKSRAPRPRVNNRRACLFSLPYPCVPF
jgi:hypothetical protein